MLYLWTVVRDSSTRSEYIHRLIEMPPGPEYVNHSISGPYAKNGYHIQVYPLLPVGGIS